MSRLATWGKAIYTIPRLDKAAWDALDPFGRWLIASRAAVLIMTFTSAAIPGLLAYRDGKGDLGAWLVCALGLVLAHATNNIVNDLTDSYKGVDKGNYFRTRYGTQPVEQGLLSYRQAMGYAAVTGALALACGAYLAWLRGPTVLVLTAVGAFFVLFYTWPLKHIGLGEPAVVVVWGPLLVGGSYFVTTGAWDRQVMVAGLPFALAATCVLFGKHIDKLDADRGKGVRTLPVILGERASRFCVGAMVVSQYLLVGYLMVTRYLSPVALVVLVAGSAAWMLLRAYKDPMPSAPPPEFPDEVWPLWFSAFAFHHTRRFGMAYLAAIALDVVARKVG